MTFKNSEGQVARWIQRLYQEYDFETDHCLRGRCHNADALSKRPCLEGSGHCRIHTYLG